MSICDIQCNKSKGAAGTAAVPLPHRVEDDNYKQKKNGKLRSRTRLHVGLGEENLMDTKEYLG